MGIYFPDVLRVAAVAAVAGVAAAVADRRCYWCG